jgi:hypothetical protein
MGKAIEKSHGSSPKIPWLVALAVLEKAHPYFKEKRGIGFGRLTLMYQMGECKITPLEVTTPGSLAFRVQVYGNGTNISIQDILAREEAQRESQRPSSLPLA